MIVSIVGNPGSGKSTLANDLNQRSLLMTRVRGDHYALPLINDQDPKEYFTECKIDWGLMDTHMTGEPGTEISTPQFDYSTFTRISEHGDKPFTISPIFLIDQVYPHPKADFIIYTYIPEPARKLRGLKRDIAQRRGVSLFKKSFRGNNIRVDLDQSFKFDLKVNTLKPRGHNAKAALHEIFTHYKATQ